MPVPYPFCIDRVVKPPGSARIYELLIARLDHLSRREGLQAKLQATDWDLVVFDEAHFLALLDSVASPTEAERRIIEIERKRLGLDDQPGPTLAVVT